MLTKLRIGLFGYGTVGSGIYDIIAKSQSHYKSLGLDISIAKVCVTNIVKHQKKAGNQDIIFVTKYDDILSDKEINCIIEVIGGITDAKRIVFDAIKSDKHVITANKALIATFMTPLVSLLAQHPKVQFGYEASVCGGIPIITTLQNAFLGDSITSITGIMNGTTNYMLSKMDKEGLQYADVLKEAQELGFAEANPSADVDGFDVQAKIAILAKLAFGGTIVPEHIPTVGITNISSADFAYAKLMHCTVKLLGVASKNPAKVNEIAVYVSPVLVPIENVIASVNGATNLVNIKSSNMINSSFVGEGAGKAPTANSVLSDVLQLARGVMPSEPFPEENKNIVLQTDYNARFYVRITICDQVGIIRIIGGLAEEAGVSIYSILQLPILDPSNTDFVVTTDMTALSSVEKMCKAISSQTFVLTTPLHFPILE